MINQRVSEYLYSLQARRVSVHTEADYRRALARLVEWVGQSADPASITPRMIEQFLAALPVGKKTVQNHYIALSAFWTWLTANHYAPSHILRVIPRPKAPAPPIVPFAEVEIRRLLDGCSKRPMLRAAILLLLDTGARASELRDLNIGDCNLRAGQIVIASGKGGKGRIVPFSESTAKAITRYLPSRADARNPEAPLLVSANGTRLDRRRLTNQLNTLGRRCGIQDVYPHRFRHTFAIEFLRNGGDVFSLQQLMGHEQLTTTRRYLALARVDVEQAHRRASPVDNWKL